MTPVDSEPRSGRSDTDTSLQNERDKADAAMVRNGARDAVADELVQRARVAADRVLSKARDTADASIASASPGAVPGAALCDEREAEDKRLSQERATADERVRRERVEAARTLARLLPLERESTDRNLVTERARADDAIAHRDDFLGMVTHDLRNLLAGVVSSADLLQLVAGDQARTAAEATRIHRYAARMNRLIGDLLDVASIDAGRLAIEPIAGDLTPVLVEAVELFASSAAAKVVELRLIPPATSLDARFDHDRLLQVVANLLSNAIKFTPKGGQVTIDGERINGAVRISVTDTGDGIAPTLLETIFERFWQAGANDRRGLGLGLYISRRIIEAHGGRLWAENRVPAGATLRLTLPA